MATKHWIRAATQCLHESLRPVPHEVNELDWMVCLTDHKDGLAEHLMAFANHANGGYLAFGIDNSGAFVGVSQTDIAQVANTLANFGRDAIEPALAIDHAAVDFEGTPLMLVHQLRGDCSGAKVGRVPVA